MLNPRLSPRAGRVVRRLELASLLLTACSVVPAAAPISLETSVAHLDAQEKQLILALMQAGETLGRELRTAAATAPDPALAAFLRARAADLATADHAASEAAWLAARGSRVQAWFGPAAAGTGAPDGAGTAFAGWIGLLDEAATARLQRFAAALPGFEAELCATPKTAFSPAQIVVMNDLARYGSRRGSESQLAILPVDEALRETNGRVLVWSHNVFLARAENDLARGPVPVRLARTPAAGESSAAFDADDLFDLMMGHYLAHALGPKEIVVDGATVTVNAHFGALHGALEETKAELLSAWAQGRLSEGSRGSGATPARYLAGLVFNMLDNAADYRAGEAPEQHGKSALLVLNWLRGHNALREAGAGEPGVWLLDPEKASTAVDALIQTVLAIQQSGDRTGADDLLAEYGNLDDGLERSLDAQSAASRPDWTPKIRPELQIVWQ